MGHPDIINNSASNNTSRTSLNTFSMGTEQSSARGHNPSQSSATEKKTCYYELLGVSRTATDEEIKKAYRRKALELHPDRNYGNVENATKLFAEIQTANEVLSDPQERAWYDSHRDAILNNESANEFAQGQNVQVTSASKIVKLMSKFSSSTPFTDAPDGFYASLRGIFQTLASEEDAACEWEALEPVDYPDFGTKEDIDNYEEVVRPFYATWTGFSTKKTFSWKDIHRSSEAPDRHIRRLMEKENKQLRDMAIREFNETVRSLVLFARKRDPRYRPNTQSEAERQKALLDASLAQAKKARAANAAKLADRVVPEWTKSRDDVEEEEELLSESEESEEQVVLRCDFCNKTFKSEQQFEAHEKSKKHTKLVQGIKRQMRKDKKDLNLDEALSGGISTPAAVEPEEPEEPIENEEDQVDEERDESGEDEEQTADVSKPDGVSAQKPDETDEKEETIASPEASNPESSPELSSEEGEDYASREAVASRLTEHILTDLPEITSSVPSPDISDSGSRSAPVLGKAKAKRAKKQAAQQAAAAAGHVCAACKESFPSKTKLFKHVQDERHALPPGPGQGGAPVDDEWGKGGKGKKKKKSK